MSSSDSVMLKCMRNKGVAQVGGEQVLKASLEAGCTSHKSHCCN